MIVNDYSGKRRRMKDKRAKIALISTKGGHFEQLTNLSDFYDGYDHFWITNQNKQTLKTLENERKYFVNLAHFKKPWTYLFQIPSFIRIFAREKPTHVLSTGSGMTAFVPFLMAKLLRIKFLYVDTFSRVNGYSKLGTFLLKLKQPIFSQWEDPRNSNVVYIGPVFKRLESFQKNGSTEYIFVTVGTREEPFVRLIKAVEDLKNSGKIKEKVIVQAGATKWVSKHMEIFDYCDPEKIEELIKNAKYVVTQESAGIGTICLKYQTKFLVMPRDFSFGELQAKSDMNEDLHLKLEQMGYTIVVNSVSELERAIGALDRIRTGFHFDNRRAIETLNQCMEDAA
jgi:UDP-N-acetylglucosamine transferase subunit ALG13